jgi:hypothetical protein
LTNSGTIQLSQFEVGGISLTVGGALTNEDFGSIELIGDGASSSIP